MKIQATVTVHDTVEVEFSLPYFCKNQDAFIAVFDETRCLVVKTRDGWSSIVKTSANVYHPDIAKAVSVQPEEFYAAYNEALNQLNLLEAA